MKILIPLIASLLMSWPVYAGEWYPGEKTVERGIRTGAMPSGSTYRILPDKSGAVAGKGGTSIWLANCKTDPMNDRKTCELRDVWDNIAIVFVGGDKPTRVCVAGHDFPGRTAMMRIDQNKAIDTDEDGCVSGSFVQQMLKGKLLKSRKVEWPEPSSTDNIIDTELENLKDALELEKYIRRL